LLKNSITLIETLISLIILSTIVTGFLKISYNNSENNLFNIVNNIENNFTTKNYSSFIQSQANIQIIKNENQIETLNVKKYEYIGNNIRVFKYEK